MNLCPADSLRYTDQQPGPLVPPSRGDFHEAKSMRLNVKARQTFLFHTPLSRCPVLGLPFL